MNYMIICKKHDTYIAENMQMIGKGEKIIGFEAKKIFSGIILFILPIILSAQGPDTLWTRTYGSVTDDGCFSVDATADGGFIAVGYTYFYGPYKVYIIKTDNNGDALWTKTYGIGFGNSIQETTDKGYIITGEVEACTPDSLHWASDVYLIKTDSLGDTLWTRHYGGEWSDDGNSVRQTKDGGYIVIGFYGNWIEDDFYLIKTDSLGNTLWTKTFGGSDHDLGKSVQQTSDCGYIITGWTKSFGQGIPKSNVYLIKTDSLGDTLWTKTFGGNEHDVGFDVQKTSDGGYVVTGYKESVSTHRDVYLIKTDANGDTLWTKTYGGNNNEWGYSVQQTSDMGYIIAGHTWSFGSGICDFYIIKTDANGEIIWTQTYGGSNWDLAWSVQQTEDGGYIIAGETQSFGSGWDDFYLVRLKPDLGVDDNEPSQTVFFISQCEPNPSKDRFLIKYGLTQNKDVRITIYNLLGQQIKTLVHEKMNAGTYNIVWDGNDNKSCKVPAGIYFIHFTIEPGGLTTGYGKIEKVILLR